MRSVSQFIATRTAWPHLRTVLQRLIWSSACFLGVAGFPVDAQEAERPYSKRDLASRISECGVAAVYCALIEVGHPVDLDSLRGRFASIHGSRDLSSLSIQEMVAVLELCGIKATAVRFGPPDVGKVPLPAILYTSPHLQTKLLGTGHFATLVEVQDEYAVVIDLTLAGEGREDGVVLVHKERLRNVWHGEAILLGGDFSASNGRLPNGFLACTAFVLIGVVAGLGWSTVRNMNRA